MSRWYSNELYHHGIKGQKWGDRNGPPYPLSPEDHSEKEKKEKYYYSMKNPFDKDSRLKKISDEVKSRGGLRKRKTNNPSKASSKTTNPLQERFSSPIKKMGIMSGECIKTTDINPFKLFTFRSLKDEGIALKKGEAVQHVMSTPTKDLTNRDYLFIAATDADKKNYAGFFAALTKFRSNVDQMYKMEITLAQDIVSPSFKERFDTFKSIYNENPNKVGKQLAEFNKRNYPDSFPESVEELTKKYSNLSSKDLKSIGYYTYANSWFDPEAGTLSDMRSRLETKGYNAIIDDNDKRSFVQSQAPLIVFDIQKNFGDMKVAKLSEGEIRRNMLEWQEMKHCEGE